MNRNGNDVPSPNHTLHGGGFQGTHNSGNITRSESQRYSVKHGGFEQRPVREMDPMEAQDV